VAVLVAAFSGPAEGGLKGETVDEVELAPHHDPGRTFSGLLNDKGAIVEIEVFIILAVEQWKDTFFQSIGLLI